jgi:hypothetical protein
MRIQIRFLVLAATSMALILAANFKATAQATGQQEQPQEQAQGQQSSVVTQVVDRIVGQETQLMKSLGHYSPRVETYIQVTRPNKKQGLVVAGDHYFLGRLDLSKGITEHSLLPGRSVGSRILGDVVMIGSKSVLTTMELRPNVFGIPIFVDTAGFNRQRYDFEFVRREFLGEVRCLVFDVSPHVKGSEGLFKGRIWVEDQDYNIVRINGVYTGKSRFGLHFDSWRQNVQPGMWFPVYIYSEESDLGEFQIPHVGFKSQTRFWGYQLKSTNPEEELTRVQVDAPTSVDASEAEHDNSPLGSARIWQQQAADNILERLEKAGLIAPPGNVEFDRHQPSG